MNKGYRGSAKSLQKRNWAMIKFIVPAALVFSIACAAQGRAQTLEGDASNQAFDLLIKRFAPPMPTFILTPEHYVLWMPSPSDVTLASPKPELGTATGNNSLTGTTFGESGAPREGDGPLWGQQDLDNTSFGTSALQSKDDAITGDLQNASAPTVERDDMQNQLQALVIIEPEVQEPTIASDSSRSSLSGSGNTDVKQEAPAKIKAKSSVDVVPGEPTPASVTADAPVEPISGPSVKDSLKVPPTPASRPREAYETAPASNSASADPAASLEVLTGSEAQILYDQLISSGTTRGSQRMDGGSIPAMPSQVSPLQVSPAQKYTVEQLNAMTPTERWDARMGQSSQ